jgi:crotonobetainyl-CoA:carnitine CoA-transferase CaiB-like acyl-CoA transferase
MAAVEPKFWSRFRELAGLSSLSDDDGLVDGERADVVKQVIAERISSRSSAEWREIFSGEDACVDVYVAE